MVSPPLKPHALKVLFSILFRLDGKNREFNSLQFSNALSPISVTLFGMAREPEIAVLLKAQEPIDVTVFGIAMLLLFILVF